MSRVGRVLRAIALAGSLGGCGGQSPGAFTPSFPDNDPGRSEATLRMLGRARVHTEQPWMLVVRDGTPARVERVEPSTGRRVWSRPLDATSTPLRFGALVLVATGPTLHGLNFADGRERFEHTLQLGVPVGFAVEGETLFVVSRAAKSAGAAARSMVEALAVDDGALRWRHVLDGVLGAPAAAGGVVALPWQQQALVLLDAHDGRERARLRTGDDVFRWVRVVDGVLLAGDRSIHQITDTYAGVWQSGSTIPLPLDKLPGEQGPFRDDLGRVARPPRTPGGTSLHFELAAGDGVVRLAQGRLYQVLYRHVFAFDGDGRLLWARALAHDVAAAHATDVGLAVVDAGGRAGVLDGETGDVHWHSSEDGGQQDSPVTGATTGGSWPAIPGPRAAALPLRQALLQMALDNDDRLQLSRRFALHRLADLETPEVTRDLLDVYGQLSTSPALQRAAGSAIAARRLGAHFLLAALEQHHDFLTATPPPPLTMLATALEAMDERRAVPLLATHLRDPATPADALAPIIEAMATLDAPAARPILWAFLRRYHRDSSLLDHPEALVAAARGIVQAGAPDDSEALSVLVAPLPPNGPVAAGIHALLRAKSQEAGARARPTEAPPVAPAATIRRPRTLSRSEIHAVFASHVDEVRRCAEKQLALDPSLTQIRIVFALTPGGRARARSYLPNAPAFVACLDPALAGYRFQPASGRGQTVRYVVSLGRGPEAEQPTPPDGWWAPARDAAGTAGRQGPPWWHDRNAVFLEVGALRAPQDGESVSASASVDRAGPAAKGSESASGEDSDGAGATGDASSQTPELTPWWTPVAAPAEPPHGVQTRPE